MTRRDRYGEPVQPVPPATVDHDPRCRNGYLGEDDNGHPIPCPACKPWLVACPTCGTSMKRCEFDRAKLNGRCCPDCPHIPPGPTKRRRASQEVPR